MPVAAVELARGPDAPAVADRLVAPAVCRTPQSAVASLTALDRRLQPVPGVLNKLYLHVTFGCQLHCTHCYARAGTTATIDAELPPDAIGRLVRQAKSAAFPEVVITGGEPLIHSRREAMLDALAALRPVVAPMKIVLRTNFALPFTDDNLQHIATAFDQIVVSVDGSHETHDARRGLGTFDQTRRNLERYQALLIAPPPRLEILRLSI